MSFLSMSITGRGMLASLLFILQASLCQAQGQVFMAAPGGCQMHGMFLPMTGQPCFYVECLWGPEPWQDEQGNIPLTSVMRNCAPGSAVPSFFTGGVTNPCTDMSNPQCAATPGPVTPGPIFPTAGPVFPTAGPVFPTPHPGFTTPRPIFPTAGPVFPTAGPVFPTLPPVPTPPPTMMGGCQVAGQFLPISGGDRCNYMECVQTKMNVISPITRPCPPGSRLAANYQGGNFFPGMSPCTEFSGVCQKGRSSGTRTANPPFPQFIPNAAPTYQQQSFQQQPQQFQFQQNAQPFQPQFQQFQQPSAQQFSFNMMPLFQHLANNNQWQGPPLIGKKK